MVVKLGKCLCLSSWPSRWPNFSVRGFISSHTNEAFDYYHLYSAYTDDTIFFLKDTISIKNMVDTFQLFFWFWLKPNLLKCEITGIGVLKGVQVAVCGMCCLDQRKWYFKNIRYSLFLQWKTERGKKLLHNSNKYSTSTEKMKNEKSYTRRENCYF